MRLCPSHLCFGSSYRRLRLLGSAESSPSREERRRVTANVASGVSDEPRTQYATAPICGKQVDRRSLLGLLSCAGLTSVLNFECEAALVDETAAQRVFATAAPSVVSVTNNRRQGGEVVEDAAGSGFVWDSRGYIVTNYHCIQPVLQDVTGSQFALVHVGDEGEQFEAVVVGTDASHDLAVLKIDAPGQQLQAIKVGSSADLKVGQSVYAIGNTRGLSKTLSAGVVSGLNRGIPTPGGAIATGTIQTDAAISSGNSGGALLDSSGRLVGISTATFNSNKSMGRGSGVNFAISVDIVRDVVSLSSRRSKSSCSQGC